MISKRRVELDIVRTIAIICVVLCHATEAIYSFTKTDYNSLSNYSKIFMIMAFTIGRLGVPLFLFLTGTLILKKKFDTDEDIKKFYKKNLFSLIRVYFIWIIIYNIYFLINNNKEFVTAEFILKEFFFLKQVPLVNMWYLPMIIGLYIGLPFVAKIIKVFSKKTIKILMICIFICTFICPMINTILAIFGIKDSYNPILNISFLGGIYGVYAIVGNYLDNGKIKKKAIWIFGAIGCYLLICAFQMFSYTSISQSTYNVWYSFPLLLIGAACMFKLIIRIDSFKINKKLASAFSFISRTSLATYLLHMIVLRTLAIYIKEWQIIMPIKVLLLFIFTLGISFLVSFILGKIQIFKKYILLIK